MGKGKRYVLLVAAFLFVVVLSTILGSGGVIHIYNLYQEKKQMAADNEKLREKNVQMRKEVEALSKNLAYLERISRQELGMVREGDLVYQFKKGQPGP